MEKLALLAAFNDLLLESSLSPLLGPILALERGPIY